LAFLCLPIPAAHRPPAFAALHDWLDTWSGIGVIAQGMGHQGFDISLTRYASEGWRATFPNAGREHSVVAGSAWESTAWAAVQGAAWAVSMKDHPDAVTGQTSASPQ
jgi:hypothetical protein